MSKNTAYKIQGIILLSIFAFIITIQVVVGISDAHVYKEDTEFIHDLQVENIKEIRIGRDCVIYPDQYQELISSLKSYKGFQPNHDYGANLGFLRITTKTEQVHRFQLYTHPKGIIVSLFRSNDNEAYETQPLVRTYLKLKGSLWSYRVHDL